MKRLKHLHKLRWKVQKCKKSKIFDCFGVYVAILSIEKLHLSPHTTLLDNEIIRG